MEICSNIIISILQTLITVTATGVVTYTQIKNSKKIKITEQQRQVYLKCIFKADKAISNPSLVFNNKYYNDLLRLKAEIKLFGSKNVVDKYRNFLEFVYNCLRKYNNLLEDDPRCSPKYMQVITNDKTGDVDEIGMITETDIQLFKDKIETYKKSHIPKSETIQKYINELLKTMRNDLEIDEF